MLYEGHAVAAARGFVRTRMPAAYQVVRPYEALTGTTFPKLKPHALWYRQPIYYRGNHLTSGTDGEPLAVPSYAKTLDYELELGFVLAHPLRDAAPQTPRPRSAGSWCSTISPPATCSLPRWPRASARRSRSVRSAMSAVVVTADEILPHWRSLKAAYASTARSSPHPRREQSGRWGEVLAHASRPSNHTRASCSARAPCPRAAEL
jgi:hypothetical protein